MEIFLTAMMLTTEGEQNMDTQDRQDNNLLGPKLTATTSPDFNSHKNSSCDFGALIR